MRFDRPLTRTLVIVLVLATTVGQTWSQFDDAAYHEFLAAHKDMTAEDLLQKYPAGLFRENANVDLQSAQYFSVIDAKLAFSGYERRLAEKHGFMVTERLSYPTYQAAYFDAYINDLPIYISSDAILHALHRSYDNMLKDVEAHLLFDQLQNALSLMHGDISKYGHTNDPIAQRALDDADVYLTVALSLLNGYAVAPARQINSGRVDELLQHAEAEQMAQVVIFGQTPRDYDFSQMKPRGHYTETPELKQYFRAMIWLGRTEIYLTKPKGVIPLPTDEDILEQCMLSLILLDLATASSASENLNLIDDMITRFVGTQDNISHRSLIDVVRSLGLNEATQLNDTSVLAAFQQAAIDAGAVQKILSQLLWSDPFSPDNITPAASFMLMGQRFILDSYILANVVYDKVQNRLMPSPLDAMFVLGNDAAAQLLAPELRAFQYAVNLAGLRYLTESLGTDYWEGSLYASWLSGIRALNPPDSRDHLPLFMQTGAWWEKSLNSQLTSWTELRHDNLLYAKQSYTGGVGCFYPDAYVEPEPDLYLAVSSFADGMVADLSELDLDEIQPFIDRFVTTLEHISGTCQTLSSMAQKELAGGEFSEEERELIDNWIVKGVDDQICIKYDMYDGVYPRMMYGVEQHIGSMKPNFVVADVHTQPTDEMGTIVGKVLHVATGRINTALVLPNDPRDGCVAAYVGPVGSYYEHITTNFERMTDEEWVERYNKGTSERPAWTYTYLAGDDGGEIGDAIKLATSIEDDDLYDGQAAFGLAVMPNPTSGIVQIRISIPPSTRGSNVTVAISDVRGNHVVTLADQIFDGTDQSIMWNGKSSSGELVSSGTYVVTIMAGDKTSSQIISVVR